MYGLSNKPKTENRYTLKCSSWQRLPALQCNNHRRTRTTVHPDTPTIQQYSPTIQQYTPTTQQRNDSLQHASNKSLYHHRTHAVAGACAWAPVLAPFPREPFVAFTRGHPSVVVVAGAVVVAKRVAGGFAGGPSPRRHTFADGKTAWQTCGVANTVAPALVQAPFNAAIAARPVGNQRRG